MNTSKAGKLLCRRCHVRQWPEFFSMYKSGEYKNIVKRKDRICNDCISDDIKRNLKKIKEAEDSSVTPAKQLEEEFWAQVKARKKELQERKKKAEGSMQRMVKKNREAIRLGITYGEYVSLLEREKAKNA